MMRIECDKCSSPIVNGRCACGVWYQPDEKPNLIKTMELALLAYDNQCEIHNDFSPISGDHHSGVSFVFWYGDYEQTQKVREFIDTLNKKKS